MNHASALSQPSPSFVNVDSKPYALSRAASLFKCLGDGSECLLAPLLAGRARFAESVWSPVVLRGTDVGICPLGWDLELVASNEVGVGGSDGIFCS